MIEDAARRLIPGFDPWACCEGYHFDRAQAKRIIDFATEICTFTNAEWAGLRVVLQHWQVGFLANLFGWRSTLDASRRFRKALLFCAKKQGKTELAAIVANYLLFCDG